MTEAEWLACDRPHWMLKELRPWKSRGRKMCLYVCASCRLNADRLKEPCLNLLNVAERHADFLADQREYKLAMQAVSRLTRRDKLAGGEDGPPLYGQVILDFLRFKHLPGWEGDSPKVGRNDYLSEEAKRTRQAMRNRGRDVITEERAAELQAEYDAFMKTHADLLRDIFGNFYRPVPFNPAWRTPTTCAIAQTIYDERRFDDLPILADSLEDAGCANVDILAHCRGPGPHVRGCWVVDLLMGKE